MTCKSWYINDIATVLYYAADHPVSRITPEIENIFIEHFWNGYQKEYRLASSEKEKIPLFLLYRDLMLAGYLNNLWGDKELNQSEMHLIARIDQSIEKRRAFLSLI